MYSFPDILELREMIALKADAGRFLPKDTVGSKTVRSKAPRLERLNVRTVLVPDSDQAQPLPFKRRSEYRGVTQNLVDILSRQQKRAITVPLQLAWS